MSQKSKLSDAFGEIYQVILDGITDNMASLIKSSKYGAINTTDTKTHGFYVIMFTSEAYTLHDSTTIDGRIINAGELVIKSQHIFSVQVHTNWY